jgi:nicotinate phosphoribosyltransferase
MERLALATDLYELTMTAGYYSKGLMGRATFELHVRSLPPHRSFLVAAGLEQALEYLERLKFTNEDIAFLRDLPPFEGVPAAFFDDYLPRFRFTGTVWAIEEGTPVFPPAPILRVTAPLPEAQLVETVLLAYVGFQTSIASRAVRMVNAAEGRPVVEFGSRRSHGVEAGLYAARAALIGGCAATSNVEAARRFGEPASGTMAHSWVMAHADEDSAFRDFADIFGTHAVLLLDTYDTLNATRRIVASGLKPSGVRLDSGDLDATSRAVRRILDDGGLNATNIFASGDLDEWRIAELVGSGAPIDAFGVGGALSTSSDAPLLGAVYKIVALARNGHTAAPMMKRSPGKETLPGIKQVWRTYVDGTAAGDMIGLADEAGGPPKSEPLLACVMNDGRRVHPPKTINQLRAACRLLVDRLPKGILKLEGADRYPVSITSELRRTADTLGASSK